METFKNVVKNTLLLGIVGVLLAAIAPPLAAMMGPNILGELGMKAAEHSVGTVLWTGVFFGGFGGLHAAVAPAMDWIFGAKKESATIASTALTPHEHGPCPDVAVNNINMQPNLNVDIEAKTKLYTQMLEMQKALPPERSV